MKYSKKIVSIQHLRGLAAISVLGAHTFWGFGDIGVDLFFVISGFIMFYIIDLKPNKSSISLFFDRYLRIAPIYYLFICFIWFYKNNRFKPNYSKFDFRKIF